jgi:hypothetical protein
VTNDPHTEVPRVRNGVSKLGGVPQRARARARAWKHFRRCARAPARHSCAQGGGRRKPPPRTSRGCANKGGAGTGAASAEVLDRRGRSAKSRPRRESDTNPAAQGGMPGVGPLAAPTTPPAASTPMLSRAGEPWKRGARNSRTSTRQAPHMATRSHDRRGTARRDDRSPGIAPTDAATAARPPGRCGTLAPLTGRSALPLARFTAAASTRAEQCRCAGDQTAGYWCKVVVRRPARRDPRRVTDRVVPSPLVCGWSC